MATREYQFVVGPETSTLPTVSTPTAGATSGENSSINNASLTFSVAASAATIALKANSGSDATSANPISIAFRSATLTSGAAVIRTVTSALSIVVSSGSTLGQVSAQASKIYVYAIDYSGTVELAVSHALYTEDALVSTTAEGGAGAADSETAIYSTTARSSVALRLIGEVLNTQTTAGTWAQTATKIQLTSYQKDATVTIQKFTSGSGTYYTPAGCKRIILRMIGGGGGGGGGSTGGTGGDTTFGAHTANGGVGGTVNSIGGAGGAATIGAGATGLAINGAMGGPGFYYNTNLFVNGGSGGHGYFGGGGSGGANSEGSAGLANTGGGGGGGAGDGSGSAASGGGSGGFVYALVLTPAASYSYSVGAVGSAGTAGTHTYVGGAGGSGVIVVEEYYV